MFSWYKYLNVNLVFSHLGFWIGNLFLIAPFPDVCLLVLFTEHYFGCGMPTFHSIFSLFPQKHDTVKPASSLSAPYILK